MTFLNPLVLFGLAAAAIPVILHLLNLRKLRTIDFSTLAFLKEMQQSRIRRLKLRQILLLVIRTLLVALLVLAFARPALRGSLPAGFGTRPGSTVAIVLDDSHSMLAADEGGERSAQAREAASGIVSLLREGDAAWLIRLSDLPKVTIDPPTHDFGLLEETIDRSRASWTRRPLGEGIDAALGLMERSGDVNREIYLIGDFQRTSLAGGGSDRETGAPPAAGPRAVDPRIRLFLVEIGDGQIPNAAVDSVEVVSRIFEKKRPVEIAARVRNYGPEALRNAVVSVFAGDERVAQGNVSVEPGGSETARLTFVPGAAGFVEGTVTIERDELEADNARRFALTIPERIRVLVAAGTPADARYILPALAAGSTGDGESSLIVTSTDAAGLRRANLRDYDVLVLSGIPALDRSAGDRIRTFVSGGGGLAWFPGSAVDPASANASLFSPMNLPEIRGVTGGGADGAGLHFREIDFHHPLFTAMFEKGPAGADLRRISPRILRSLDLRPTPQSRAVITLGNGGGFLLEQAVGSGRAAIFAAAPVAEWGDFPVKALFAPLVYRTVIFLAAGSESPGQYTAGARASVTLREAGEIPAGSVYTLATPGGSTELLQPDPAPGGLRFAIPSLPDPGHYRLTAGQRTLALLPVNPDPRESDLTKAGEAEVDSFLAARGFSPEQVRRLPPGDNLPERITEARFGTELWKYCLLLGLLLAFAEMAISRRAKGETATAGHGGTQAAGAAGGHAGPGNPGAARG